MAIASALFYERNVAVTIKTKILMTYCNAHHTVLILCTFMLSHSQFVEFCIAQQLARLEISISSCLK